MNLAELQAEVILITGRPDLVDLTLSAVKAATLKAHQSDFYPKDIYETGLSFTEELYEQDFEVTTFIPLFRAIKYARKYDNTNSEPGAFFELLDPINVLDAYGVARTEVCYLGGNEIHFKSAEEFQHVLFGCYINPNTASDSFTSWIAIDHPWAIINEAARRIFMLTGNAEKARAQSQLVAEDYALLRQGNILAAGF